MKITIDWLIVTPHPDGSETEATYQIECGLTPGRPGRWYMANGDPGYPDEPAECEIQSVKLNGAEVKDWEKLIDEDMQDAIAEKAWKQHSDNEAGAYGDYCDAERERRMEGDGLR